MQSSFWTAIVALIGTASTLLAVAITNRTQIRNQRENNLFQIEISKTKSIAEFTLKQRDAASAQLASAHKILNYIGREFSITEIVIMRTASISRSDFDLKYKSLCEKIDELSMIVDFYAPDASIICNEIYGQMNIFWGNFSNVLYHAHNGKEPDHRDACFQKAHEAAMTIGTKVEFAKSRIREIFRSHLTAY